ncbi:MAG: cob(I)yrinic acid a,c-diamide adenosyltransferase [bacterium]
MSLHKPKPAHPHQLHIYTGDNKGKTTAAVGLCVRALGAGKKVAMIQFDKGYDGDFEHYSERNILRKLHGMTLIPTGLERMQKSGKFRFGVTPADRKEALRGLEEARRCIRDGDQDLLVLDEILSAVTYKLVEEKELMEIVALYLQNRRHELVLTGRAASKTLIEKADLVTEMKKIKHYFDAGLPAREGIDY